MAGGNFNFVEGSPDDVRRYCPTVENVLQRIRITQNSFIVASPGIKDKRHSRNMGLLNARRQNKPNNSGVERSSPERAEFNAGPPQATRSRLGNLRSPRSVAMNDDSLPLGGDFGSVVCNNCPSLRNAQRLSPGFFGIAYQRVFKPTRAQSPVDRK